MVTWGKFLKYIVKIQLNVSGAVMNLIYKPHLATKLNSQGKKQIHSLMEKCADSLRLMNYRNFMKFMRIFFAMKNLEQRNFQ